MQRGGAKGQTRQTYRNLARRATAANHPTASPSDPFWRGSNYREGEGNIAMTAQAITHGADRCLCFVNAQGQRFRLQVEDDPSNASAFSIHVVSLPEISAPDEKPLEGEPPSIFNVLTARERDVVALAAEGLTNDQMAHRLYISRSTVKTHLQNIYAKVGVSNRTALAAFMHGAA